MTEQTDILGNYLGCLELVLSQEAGKAFACQVLKSCLGNSGTSSSDVCSKLSPPQNNEASFSRKAPPCLPSSWEEKLYILCSKLHHL